MTSSLSYIEETERLLAGHPNRDRWMRALLGEAEVGSAMARRFTALGLRNDARVLEIGCGEGGITIALQRAGFHASGLEIAADRVRTALRRADENGGKASFLRGSAYDLPIPENSVDAIVLENVIEHLEHWPQAVAQLARALRPGGLVAVTLPSRFGLRTILADPHWEVFGLVLLPRWLAKWLITRVLRRTHDYDVFEMPSLSKLRAIFARHEIDLRLNDGYDRMVYKQEHQTDQSSKSSLKRLIVMSIGKVPLLRRLYGAYRRYISEIWILEGVKRG
ncbi:class I SAM-dependent methyltransferase [Chloroflexales bacterium ZM16-3]|nr:class I SAM-dependent methyltransferase [Chloroflexales bacterium ZM16-3]